MLATSDTKTGVRGIRLREFMAGYHHVPSLLRGILALSTNKCAYDSVTNLFERMKHLFHLNVDERLHQHLCFPLACVHALCNFNRRPWFDTMQVNTSNGRPNRSALLWLYFDCPACNSAGQSVQMPCAVLKWLCITACVCVRLGVLVPTAVSVCLCVLVHPVSSSFHSRPLFRAIMYFPDSTTSGLLYIIPFEVDRKVHRAVIDMYQYSLQEKQEEVDGQAESMEEDGGGESYDGGENDGGEDFEVSASDDSCESAEV
eukprot:1156915-Pelagomonas_calceolata.AAC.5